MCFCSAAAFLSNLKGRMIDTRRQQHLWSCHLPRCDSSPPTVAPPPSSPSSAAPHPFPALRHRGGRYQLANLPCASFFLQQISCQVLQSILYIATPIMSHKFHHKTKVNIASTNKSNLLTEMISLKPLLPIIELQLQVQGHETKWSHSSCQADPDLLLQNYGNFGPCLTSLTTSDIQKRNIVFSEGEVRTQTVLVRAVFPSSFWL